MASQRAVLFVHGFGGSAYEYQPIIRHLRRRGAATFHQFGYRQNLGTVSLTCLASSLQRYVDLLPEEIDLVTVGLSQGGIIAAYWLEFLGGREKCRTCITVCTPFSGSWNAHLLPLAGLREVRPGSTLLSSLGHAMEASPVHYYGVWNPLDLFGVPGWSGCSPSHRRSRMIPAPTHPLTFWMPATLRFIEHIVMDASDETL